MNGDLTPAVIAAGGGTAMFAGIAALEHKRYSQMRRSRVRLKLRFPISLEPVRVLAALDALSGLPWTTELVFEVVAHQGRIEHFLWVPKTVRGSVEAMLRGALGSVRATKASAVDGELVSIAESYFVRTPFIGTTEQVAEASRMLLAGLANLASERAIIRWALEPGGGRRWQVPVDADSRTREIERAWRRKLADGVFGVSGLVLIQADTVTRARTVARHIESVVRSRRGVAGEMRVTTSRGRRRLSALPRVRRSSGTLSSAELLPLLGWPLGSDPLPGVEVGTSRELPVPHEVPRTDGRRLFIGRDARGERAVVLSPTAATHHAVVIGPSGSGKTVQIGGGILSDIAAGHAGVFIDPRGDAVDMIAQRVRPEHAERVVVLDAGDDSRAVPALDVLHSDDPDLAADVLVRTIRAMFPEWGIRSETYGRTGIRTLCELPGATLADLGRLFADDAYRHRAVAALSDSFLKDSWRNYEALSQAARVEAIQAPLSRVMALLARPRVRRVLASPMPKLDIGGLLADKRFLLVSLAPGHLGEAAPLIGSAVLLATWAAIEARISIPPKERHLVNLYVDELATVANGLPSNLELTAERARGLGASLTVAMQTLGRIPEPIRSSLVTNSATLITFRTGAMEAPTIARELPGLSPDDLMALGQFEVAARVGIGAGSAVRVITGRTEPLPPVVGLAETIRDASAERYGTPAEPDTAPSSATQSHPAEPSNGLLGAQRRQP